MPPWFGRTYPTIWDLEGACDARGVQVHWMDVPGPAYLAAEPAILMPKDAGPLETCWMLAHELAHLVLHEGPGGTLCYGRDEARAERWAACALIPEARIRHHQNACPDALIGALSAHFEDLPYRDCPARRLAGRIARIRLETLRCALAQP